jgi:hypothetical protein
MLQNQENRSGRKLGMSFESEFILGCTFKLSTISLYLRIRRKMASLLVQGKNIIHFKIIIPSSSSHCRSIFPYHPRPFVSSYSSYVPSKIFSTV